MTISLGIQLLKLQTGRNSHRVSVSGGAMKMANTYEYSKLQVIWHVWGMGCASLHGSADGMRKPHTGSQNNTFPLSSCMEVFIANTVD
jgi:hypothetical protein